MNNDENWEKEIDWSKRTAVVGGPIFYEFVRSKAIPALDEGLAQMADAKAAEERKLRRWNAIAERAAKLSDCFAALTEEEDFMRMVHDFDESTKALFKGECIPSIGAWLLIGKRFTDAMKKGSTVPAKYEAELNSVTQEIASMTAVRDIFRSFVAASDNDYRLRCAPTRFRTRVFRDLSQNFNDIVESSLKVDFAELPKAIDSLSQTLKVIIEVSRKMQGICRRAKKDIKRRGSAFWAKLDAWNALRSAVRRPEPAPRPTSPPRCRVSGFLHKVGQVPAPRAETRHGPSSRKARTATRLSAYGGAPSNQEAARPSAA